LVGNFTGEADFLEQHECLAGSPRVYGQLVSLLGKYSKFAPAGEKAALRQAAIAADNPEVPTEATPAAGAEDAPF
jgi:myo-inositol-1(or 4)-monophosphatase